MLTRRFLDPKRSRCSSLIDISRRDPNVHVLQTVRKDERGARHLRAYPLTSTEPTSKAYPSRKHATPTNPRWSTSAPTAHLDVVRGTSLALLRKSEQELRKDSGIDGDVPVNLTEKSSQRADKLSSRSVRSPEQTCITAGHGVDRILR